MIDMEHLHLTHTTPDGWQKDSVGHLIVEQQKSPLNVSDASGFGLYPFFTSGEVILRHNQMLVDGENLYLADGGVADIKFYEGEASYSNHTYTIQTTDYIDTKFLYYCLISIREYINNNYFQGTGLKNLQKKDFKKHELFFPKDIEEQKRIAALLTQIDLVIADTKKLIAKYRNIKAGLMQDLLTKGIDENGNIRSEETHEFKDSELGRIPAEWECSTLGNICSNIEDCPHSTPNYIDSGVLVARTFCIKNGQYLSNLSSYLSEDDYKERILRIEPLAGDVIFTREAPIGEAFVIPNGMKICLGQRVTLIRTNHKILLPEFFVLFNYSDMMQLFYKATVGGTTVSHLNVKDIKKMVCILPTIKEQKVIIKMLNPATEQINSLNVDLQKLQNIREGLLHDLLSGDIRIPSTIKL